jgi:hypothetical protein
MPTAHCLQYLDAMAPRVVLLTKPYPLATALERRIAATGCLAGVVHEQPRSGWRAATREAQRLIKRLGVLRTADVLAYQLYQRVARARELNRRMAALLAAQPAPPARDVPRAVFPTLNSPEAHAAIRALAPDLLIVHGTGILKPDTFGLAPLAVNLHCGVLPEYRGHDSTFWALHRGDFDRVGASLHVIDAGVDTGSLIAVARVPCGPADGDLDVWMSAFDAGVDLAVELVETLRAGRPLKVQRNVGPPGKHYGRKGLSDYLAFARRRRAAAARRGSTPPTMSSAA